MENPHFAQTQENSSVSVPQSQKDLMKHLLVVAGMLLLAVLSGLGGYFLGVKQSKNKEVYQAVSSVDSTSSTADQLPIDSLPYNYIKSVNIDQNWVERGIKQDPRSLREFDSTNHCATVYIIDLGPLTSDLEKFVSQQYQLPFPINQEALYKTQYKIGDYTSITIGPMGQGEVNNTIIDFAGRALAVSTILNLPDGVQTELSSCTFPEASAQQLIESIRVQ